METNIEARMGMEKTSRSVEEIRNLQDINNEIIRMVEEGREV